MTISAPYAPRSSSMDSHTVPQRLPSIKPFQSKAQALQGFNSKFRLKLLSNVEKRREELIRISRNKMDKSRALPYVGQSRDSNSTFDQIDAAPNLSLMGGALSAQPHAPMPPQAARSCENSFCVVTKAITDRQAPPSQGPPQLSQSQHFSSSTSPVKERRRLSKASNQIPRPKYPQEKRKPRSTRNKDKVSRRDSAESINDIKVYSVTKENRRYRAMQRVMSIDASEGKTSRNGSEKNSTIESAQDDYSSSYSEDEYNDILDTENAEEAKKLMNPDTDSDEEEEAPRKKFSCFLKALGTFDDYMKLMNEEPKPPKIKDPFHYYNVSALPGMTPFYSILNMYMEDRALSQLYMHKFDRAANMHGKQKQNTLVAPYKIAKVNPKKSFLVDVEPVFKEPSPSKGPNTARTQSPNKYCLTQDKLNYYRSQLDTTIQVKLYERQHDKTVILNFEGVLGNIFKKNRIADWPAGLYMRPDLTDGISLLSHSYDIILVVDMIPRICKRFLRFLKELNIRLYAVYRVKSDQIDFHHSNKWYLNYDLIWTDLSLNSHETAIITSIDVQNEDIASLTGSNLVSIAKGTTRRPTVTRVPIGNFTPTVIAVPNPVAQNSQCSLSMRVIASLLLDYTNHGFDEEGPLSKYWKFVQIDAYYRILIESYGSIEDRRDLRGTESLEKEHKFLVLNPEQFEGSYAMNAYQFIQPLESK